jgi:hypothetical protein
VHKSSAYLTVASRCWKDLYDTVESQQLQGYDAYARRSDRITCVPQMTLFSSVFASSSRVQLAHMSGLDCCSKAYQHAAGKFADIAALATAHELGMQYTSDIMAGAGLCDKLAEVQFLYSHDCPWSNGQLLEVAAESGYFELLRWCYEHGCRFEEACKAPEAAAASGNVELMAWALQQPDTTLSEDAMSTAAAKGHTAMCAFLREQQCPWDIRSPQVAATGRHIDCLRWLLDNGCPWDDQMCFMCCSRWQCRGADLSTAARHALTQRNANIYAQYSWEV